jgi:hypothetical protein
MEGFFVLYNNLRNIVSMEPLAFLILSNLPGENRLKNLKYFLGLGDNVAGTDSRCQIVLP